MLAAFRLALRLCVAALLLGPLESRAGAFLEKPGEGQVISTLRFSQTNIAYDSSGHMVLVDYYRKFEMNALAEYGATDWLTVIFQPSLMSASQLEPVPAKYTGLGRTDIGARVALMRFERGIISAQTVLALPGSNARGNPMLDGQRAVEADARVLAGYSFELWDRAGFANLEVGYRTRADGWPNEVKIDTAFGLSGTERNQLLIQTFSTFAGASVVQPKGMQSHKLQMSFVRKLGAHWSLQTGGYVTVHGRNASLERGSLIALWYRF